MFTSGQDGSTFDYRHQRRKRVCLWLQGFATAASRAAGGNAFGGVQRGGAYPRFGNGVQPRRSARAGGCGASDWQFGGGHRQRLVPHGGDAGCALLHAHALGNCPRGQRQSAHPRGGCNAQRAAAAGVDGARNAAQPRPFGQYAPRKRNGRHRVPARARALYAA